MKGKLLFIIALVALMVMPIVLAADAEAEICGTVSKIIDLVRIVGGAIAVLAITVVGVMMFQAKDPTERDQLKEKLKYVIIGLVVIVIAPMIVGYILPGSCI